MFSIFSKTIKIFGFSKRSAQWSNVRKKHLEKNPACAICGSKIKPEVHHIVPVNIDKSKELDDNNLITLCDKYCHFIFGHLMSWHSWNTDILSDAKLFSKKINNRP